jgi:hypothetical protein
MEEVSARPGRQSFAKELGSLRDIAIRTKDLNLTPPSRPDHQVADNSILNTSTMPLKVGIHIPQMSDFYCYLMVASCYKFLAPST